MGCLLAIFSLFAPRLIIIILAVFTDYFGRAYETFIWPVLGFIFMPYTTLAYLWAMISNGEVSGGWIVLIIVAVLLDLGGQSSTASSSSSKS